MIKIKESNMKKMLKIWLFAAIITVAFTLACILTGLLIYQAVLFFAFFPWLLLPIFGGAFFYFVLQLVKELFR